MAARRSKDVHVSKDKESGDWKKTVSGEEVGGRHRTQKAAVEAAIPIARKNQSDVVTHGLDGKIKSKDSYGRDPNPPRDKER